jgi:hypothetical protein
MASPMPLGDRDPDEMELLMSLTESPVFVEYMERATADALNEGVKTGYQSVAESMIVDRFESLDEELSAILPNILQLSPSEFTPLLMHLSREDLIDRFTDHS